MNIVTIMNFVRGCEPRYPQKDLLELPARQNELHKKYGFPNTFLLQYDAIIREDFASFFKKEKDDNTELGVWIEIVRPLTEKVGIEWRGRPGYDWDWFVNPGFLPAYTAEQKEALIDELMAKFKEVFGYYPKTAASWLIDAYSMDYMSKRYGISTLGICREQLAVDAYTLWGGPYNQPYYPSKNNMLCPAQTEEQKINTPVFRLLGIEPVRAYWEERYSGGCATMEPFWDSAKQEDYMKWFFGTYFDNENMGLSYTQIGQENCFGWRKIKDGVELQYSLLDKYRKEGRISLMKMSKAGEYFKSSYPDTPPQAIVADGDATAENKYKSIWFSDKYYRANLFCDGARLYFRDIHRFDEGYTERYLDEPCRVRDAVYDNLPVVSERPWAKSMDDPRSGLFFEGNYKFQSVNRDGNTLISFFDGDNGERVKVVFGDKEILVESASPLALKFGTFTDYEIKGNKLCLEHNGYNYSVELFGDILKTEDGFILSGDQKKFIFG